MTENIINVCSEITTQRTRLYQTIAKHTYTLWQFNPTEWIVLVDNVLFSLDGIWIRTIDTYWQWGIQYLCDTCKELIFLIVTFGNNMLIIWFDFSVVALLHDAKVCMLSVWPHFPVYLCRSSCRPNLCIFVLFALMLLYSYFYPAMTAFTDQYSLSNFFVDIGQL